MSSPLPRLAFGPFVLDLQTLELERDGVRVALTPQPARVLALLLTRPGELVDREEIRRYVWGDQAVEFDAGLHSCIRQIRRALEDSPDDPTWVETVPRRGYRFVGAVGPADAPGTRSRRSIAAGAAGLAVLGALLTALALWPPGDPESVGPVRLVVMPFDNLLSERNPDVAFVSAIDEEIRTELSRLDPERLGVIARASSRVLHERSASLPEIRRRVEATHLLEGAVRRTANGVSVTARLVRAEDEVQVWADRFVRPGADADIALGVAQQVTRRLAPELLPALRTAPPTREVPDDARLALLEADHLLREWRTEPAVSRLREAVAIAPSYAEAHALLAEAHARSSSWAEAEDEARQALALDDDLAAAARTLGDVELYGRLNVDAAGRWYDRAAELAPTDPDVLMSQAWWWVARGDVERAIEVMRTAQRWDPVSPLVHGDAPWFFFYARRFEEALAESRRNLDLLPQLQSARQCALSVALVRKDLDEVTRLIDELRELAGRDPAGAPSSYEAVLRRTIDAVAANSVAPMRHSRLARLRSLLGERDEALADLGRALEQRETDLLWVAVDPHYDALREDPRFETILDAIARLGRSETTRG